LAQIITVREVPTGSWKGWAAPHSAGASPQGHAVISSRRSAPAVRRSRWSEVPRPAAGGANAVACPCGGQALATRRTPGWTVTGRKPSKTTDSEGAADDRLANLFSGARRPAEPRRAGRKPDVADDL